MSYHQDLRMAQVDTPQFRDLATNVNSHRGDRVFNRTITGLAFSALIILAGITVFLGAQTVPVLKDQGLSFLTSTIWDSLGTPPQYGIWGMLYGSILLSVIALVIAVPASLLLSIFMTFMAPKPLAKVMTNVIDLMAAIPSVIIGLWAFYILAPTAVGWQELMNQYLGWIPIFQNESGNFNGTPFIAGFVLAVMMIPIITSVTREVMGRTPPELINASEALGCSLWTMLRYVALPFGRGGIIGGIMLGLGRALGETIAVFFVLKLVFDVNYFHIIQSGGGSVATLIVSKFGDASGPFETQVLLAAGFFLFAGTLVVNVIANLIVKRTGRLQS
jgi:phosphate transport system permease protein